MKYGLMLNDMRQPNIENIQCVKVGASRQELVAWHNSMLADKPWSDGQWGKAFKPGSQLEWFNPAHPSELEKASFFGGIAEFPDTVTDEQLLGYRLAKG